DVNQDDPRVGSSRDNETSPSALHLNTASNSNSVATLFSTLIPVSIYATVCLLIFWVLRRKFPRVYAPRTFLSSLDTHERSDPLPGGWFNWIPAFYRVPDTTVLNKSSIDGYLFLRYLKLLCVICGMGCIITWPVLLPMHTYGGKGSKQLDQLTFGNVVKPNWYYVHAAQAWLFFGFILYMVSRECVFFINLRQAYLLSPYYAERLSSRTVLFTCVPYQILDERKLRKIFGESVRRIWIPRDTDDLDELVNDREETALRLERAENLLIRKVNTAYIKALKNGHPDIYTQRWSQDTEPKEANLSVVSLNSPKSVALKEIDEIASPISPASPGSPDMPSSPREFLRVDGTPGLKTSYGFDGPAPDINGSVAAQWIPYSSRPVHRPLSNYGRRVDTIKWSRRELKEMAPKIAKLRRHYKKGNGRPIAAVFIEFDSQANAQSAYQTLAHHRANHMVPDIVGVRPQEIIWQSLQLRWWERIVRRFAIQAFIAVLVIFWSIPCALVGIISNVKFLTNAVFFLAWINKLPSVILGLISGLLPAVGLSLLMSAVPYIMRGCARAAGVPTQAKIELFTQNAYFVFQVVQVFLVTTLTSAASSAVKGIIDNPMSAQSILAQNLPTASNFYVSYFILQGLAMSATRMVHLGGIFRFQIFSAAIKNPRLRSMRYHRLRIVHWGAIYPVFTNMGVIAISYALIAPLILGVAFIGLCIIYITYRYNLLYIYSSEFDARGLHYPRALKQTLTGIYLAEICMVGLFVLKKAFGPMVLMVGLVIFTALVHISLNDALLPLLYNLPRTLAVEEELRRAGHNGLDAEEPKVEDPEQQDPGYDSDFDPGAENESNIIHDPQTLDRGIPRAEGEKALKLTANGLASFIRFKVRNSPFPGIISSVDFWSYWITPDPLSKPNVVLKWLHPEVFADYSVLRQAVPEYPPIIYDENAVRVAFMPPAMKAKTPRIRVPRDKAGVSLQECRHSGEVLKISDEGAWIDEKGLITVDLDDDPREVWEQMRF
ncbi:hypothetical protein B0O99DRAFT_514425, partial [Bisporella sp. PMI_857]